MTDKEKMTVLRIGMASLRFARRPGSARADSMQANERARGHLWCSLCKTRGSHYTSECPTPLAGLGSIRMMTADRKVLTGWLASQTDMLSEDWELVED